MSFKPKIAVIRQLALGDVILTTPIVKQIYADYSGVCDIDVITLKPEAYKYNPMVSQVRLASEPMNFIGTYDKIINLDLAYEKYPKVHILEAYALYSHGSLERIHDKKIDLYSSPEDHASALKLINEQIQGEYLVIHMRRDTWPSRNLRPEVWKSIIDQILMQTTLKIVQIGSEGEIAFDHDPRLINLLGALNLAELREIISNSKLFFGIDSGTLHVASSTDTPIICLFTSAHHSLRMPLERSPGAVFLPIAPRIGCYGCQSSFAPPITGVVCPMGDPFSPPCRDLFDLDDISKTIRAVLG